MGVVDEIRQIASTVPAELKENKGLFTLEYVVAERKAFLSKKKLVYTAKFRVKEDKKEILFTEMLKESGLGLSGGDLDTSPGFGFKTETYKTSIGPRQGTIEEQSDLFGKKYTYAFDFNAIRKAVERIAVDAGYAFRYQVTGAGL